MNPKDISRMITEDPDATQGDVKIERDGDLYKIYYLDNLIKITKDKNLAEKALFFEEIHDNFDDFKPYFGNDWLYKATDHPEKIPGFTTTDLNRAKMFHKKFKYLIRTKLTKIPQKLREAIILDGQYGSCIIMPGMPTALRRGNEVLILHPEEQQIISSASQT